MTCVGLYEKVSEGRQSHYLEIKEGIGCEECPYYVQGAYDHIFEENDRPCYRDLLSDEDNLKWALLFVDVLRDNK